MFMHIIEVKKGEIRNPRIAARHPKGFRFYVQIGAQFSFDVLDAYAAEMKKKASAFKVIGRLEVYSTPGNQVCMEINCEENKS